MKKKKILFNGHPSIDKTSGKSLHRGGPRNFYQNLLNHLPSKYHYTSLLVGGKAEKNDKYEISKETDKNHSIVSLKLRLNTPEITNTTNTQLKHNVIKTPISIITKIIADENPDLIVFNGFSIAIWYMLQAADRLNIPVITVHHGLWFRDIQYSGQFTTPESIKIALEMERDIIKFSKKQIFLNNFSKNDFETKLGKIPEDQAIIIPLPYNPIFAQNKKTNTISSRKIGTVGRWDPIKNPAAYLNIAHKAKSEQLNWKFYSIIDINTNYPPIEYLKNDYKKFITVMPTRPPEKLAQFYQDMGIILMPSSFDVSPTVVMESILQNRITLISPNMGWVDSYTKFGQESHIVNYNNNDEVIKKIKENIGQKPSALLRKYILEEHNPKNIFSQYNYLFEKFI